MKHAFRHSFRHVRPYVAAAVAAFAAIVSIAAVSAAPTIPPGTPPDIAAILAKGQSGQPLTMAEIMKLSQWSTAVQTKLNPGGGLTPSQYAPSIHPSSDTQGVPCDIRYSVEYSGQSRSSDSSYNESTQLSVRAKCVMFAQTNGTDDYFGTTFAPDTKPSSFRFEPLKAGNTVAQVGGGSFHQATQSHTKAGPGTTNFEGNFKSAVSSFMLVTSGHGETLYPWSGGSGGVGSGTMTATDKDGSHTYTMNVGNEFLDGFGMFAAEVNANPTAKPGAPCPMPTMQFSLSQITHAIAAGSPQTITGSEPFHFTKGGIEYVGTETLSITMRPKPLALLIEPVDEAAYKKWIPMPDATDTGHPEFFGHPDPIKFHVVMNDPTQGAPQRVNGLSQPNTSIRGRIDVYLDDVVTQAGICMNYPSHTDPKKALFFPHDQPADIEWIDEQHVRTSSPAAFDATVNVMARDTGAYGKIDAKCEPLGIDSKNADHPDLSYVSLPLDDNGNHVADQWEKDHNDWDRNLASNWDAEDEPPGWKTKGDGLSFYEEYRGFIVENSNHAEEFQRLEQEKRKLFLFLPQKDKDLHEAGAELFKHATGVEIVYLHDTARLKPMQDVLYPRWINFNETPDTLMKQACVWVDDWSDSQPGFLKGVDSNGDAKPHCPVEDNVINLSRNACQTCVEGWVRDLPQFRNGRPVWPPFVEAANSTGLNLTTIGDTVEGRTPTLVNQMIVFCTMHELGHALGGRHHGLDEYLATPVHNDAENAELQSRFYGGGVTTCPMRYWHYPHDQSDVIRFLAGQWDLMTAPDGTDWKFCPDDQPNFRIKP
jgi:hypothetical protein